MNTIQKLATIGEDNSLIWYQKGRWVSELSNVITIDPDKGIDLNGVPIGGGGAVIPPIITPEKIVIEDGTKSVTISGQDGLVVSLESGGATTVNDTGIVVSNGGVVSIGSATLNAPLLSMLKETHNTTTKNIVLGETKSLSIGDQSLTRGGILSLNSEIPTRLSVIDSKVAILEGSVSTLSPLTGKVATLESTSSSHGTRITNLETNSGITSSRLTAVESGLGSATSRVTSLITRVDQVESISSAGIATISGRADVLDDEIAVLSSRVVVAENAAWDATTSASAAQASADSSNGNADAALAAAGSAQSTANSALTTANSALTTANSALTTANSALTTADSALTTADSALTTANSALAAANTADGNASTALTVANTVQGKADSALTAANAAQGSADSALTAANTAQGTANSALTTANGASTTAETALVTANRARDDIVVLKGVDVTFNNRITALENSGSGEEPIVLPFYINSSSIDFGEGNTMIGESLIKIGDGGTISMGDGALLNLGSTNSVSLSTEGVLNLGSNGVLNLGSNGVLNLGSSSLDKEAVDACGRLAAIEPLGTSLTTRIVLYDPMNSKKMEYSNLPISSFQNPDYLTPSGILITDPTLGETSLRKSILTLDGVTLAKQGIKAAAELSNDNRFAYSPGMVLVSKDIPTGEIRTTTLPSYLTSSGLTFGSNTIGATQAATLVNLSSLPASNTNLNYVSYNQATGLYGYQAKPTFIDTTNNVVGNMGGTGDATETYLTKNGVTFGSPTLFEPLENTCYSSNSLTVVDRTQGAANQRKRAMFNSNGIILYNPLATSIDDPATITLNRAKLSLIQRIAAIDVITSTDATASSTKRMLVGDKISGAYSYATIPTVPSYIGATGITLDNTTITGSLVEVKNSSATEVASISATGVFYSGTANNAKVDGDGVLVSTKAGADYIRTGPTAIYFGKSGESEISLNHANAKSLSGFVDAPNAAEIIDVDTGGAIRFLAAPSSGGVKKLLSVPSSYSWLKPGSITASLIEGSFTKTNTFGPKSIDVSSVGVYSESTNITSTGVRVSRGIDNIMYGPEKITIPAPSSYEDLTFGNTEALLGYRGVGAAISLGKSLETVTAAPGVDHIVTSKSVAPFGVRYSYLKPNELFPSLNGAVIEPKKNPGSVMTISGALPAVLDSSGLSFPLYSNPLPDGATSAPHDATTYNSNYFRIGARNQAPGYVTATNESISIVDENLISRTSINKDRIRIGIPSSRTDVYGGSINFTSDSVSTEFPGAAIFGEIQARMVNSMYLQMGVVASQRKSTMVVNNTGVGKVFEYPTYIHPGYYHKMIYSNPGGTPASEGLLNLYPSGSLGVTLSNTANASIFFGNIATVPYSNCIKLYIDLDFTSGSYISKNETRYIFLSNLYSVSDSVKFIKYRRHPSEPNSKDLLVFKSLQITSCTISHSSSVNNFEMKVLSFVSPAASGTYRGIIEIDIDRISLSRDYLTPDTKLIPVP